MMSISRAAPWDSAAGASSRRRRSLRRSSAALAGLLGRQHDGRPYADGRGRPARGRPARPSKPSAYPAVNDMPPPRGTAVLTDAEQKKLEDDLAAARNRAAARNAEACWHACRPDDKRSRPARLLEQRPRRPQEPGSWKNFTASGVCRPMCSSRSIGRRPRAQCGRGHHRSRHGQSRSADARRM